MKKVSIVIPCYNQGQYIEEAVESALNQTYCNIEIICVNDGSTDNTSVVIKNLKDKSKNIIFLDLEDNHGVVYSRNLAIDASSGDYILPLDADDTIEPTYVEKAVEILNKNPDIGIVYCNARFFGSKQSIWNLPTYNKEKILYENMIFATAMFRKNDFEKAGKYKQNMKNGYEDWDLWLSFVEKNLDVFKIDEILFNYRKYDLPSRSDNCYNNLDDVCLQIFKNHTNLYLSKKSFVKKLFDLNIEKLEKKQRKYKKLFNIFCSMFLVQLIVIIALVGINLWSH